MTFHKRVVLGRGSPGVISYQSHTDPVQSARERKTREVASPLTPSLHEPVPTQRPPPASLDEQGNLQFHVKKLLNRRHHKGQCRYLVKWRGYPESKNSWEFEVPLRQDYPYAVDVLSIALRVNLHPNALTTNRCGGVRLSHQYRVNHHCTAETVMVLPATGLAY